MRLRIVCCVCFVRLVGFAGPTVGETTAMIVQRPPTDLSNAHYVSNRPPLAASPLAKLPIGTIRPRGWLLHQLECMRDGLTGRLPELSKWCDAASSAWMSPNGEGEYGWEELPYWLRGFTDLAYVLQDQHLIDRAGTWIDGILASQEPDGYFGPRQNKKQHDVWPNMLVLNVLQSFYEATGDERVLPFMTRYFRWQASLPREHLLPGSWQKIRAGDNLESVLWLYNRTGEAWLLDLARVIHDRTVRWDLKVASWHGVNICQGFREPAVYWLLSGDRAHLDAAERNYQTVMTLYGQVPGGMFGADENCRPGYHGPRQAAESCSMVEFMHSFEMLLAITGDPLQADRCEEVAFNDLPAAMTPDLKGLHYLTAPNMVRLDRADKSPGLQNGGSMLPYDPHRYRCCQHDVSIGWPYYAEHLWMATPDNGLAAVLCAASQVTARVGDGVEVTVTEQTDYPFAEDIVLTVSAPRPVAFPLYLRVPGWCERPGLAVNGEAIEVQTRPLSYIRLERTWSEGDTVRLELPMSVAITRWRTNAGAVSVSRGPLWYSLQIGEQWTRSEGTDQWPAYDVLPTTPWNYGLVLDEEEPAASFEVIKASGPMSAQPFTPQAAPLHLTAAAKRIPAWQLDRKGLVGKLQASPARSDAPREQVALIPMGCARLRISVFPTIGAGPGAHDWIKPPLPRHEASYCWDVIYALSDGETPNSSHDQSVSRFSWGGHKGTSEWVTYRFDRPQRVAWSDVYWYADADGGYYRLPSSWKLLYRADDVWREVDNPSGCGTEADRFNRVNFEPVETTELKLEVQLQPEHSGGILEWRVGGPQGQ
ncbi:MAG: transcriptional initiation protein Tat [bacterium]|nr:transcriptional initiation protein Tat [bacterium]